MAGKGSLPSIDSNESCSICTQAAAMFCTCLNRETFLCYQCIGSHNEKYSHFAHPLLPIKARNVGFEDFQKRSVRFNERTEKMLENLKLFDQCCEELNKGVEKLIQKICRYRDQKVKELQRQKLILEGEMLKAAEKVMRSLEKNDDISESKFERYLRGHTTEDEAFFKYVLSFSVIHGSIADILKTKNGHMANKSSTSTLDIASIVKMDKVANETDPAPSMPAFLAIHLKCLNSFDFGTMRWNKGVRLRDTIKRNSGSVYTMIDNDKLFCSGYFYLSKAAEESKFAHIFSMSGDTLKLPNMNVGRCYHGVVYAARLKSIFVFGGISASGEMLKLDSSDLRWENLPDMSGPRSCFHPCLLEQSIFLCGGYSKSVDMYRTDTLCMLHSVAQLPYLKSIITVVDGDCIFGLSGGELLRLQWKENQLKTISLKSTKAYRFDTDFSPMVFEGTVFIMNSNSIVSVSLETGEVINN